MLIIPIQKKPDWRRPPLMCFALIAINLLVFVFYQGRDEERWQQAENFYFSSEMSAREEARFLVYVDELHPEWRLEVDAQGEDFVYRELLWNLEFHHWLLPQLRAEGETEWLAEREQFARLRDRLSSFALGLTPAEPGVAGLFAHMFLHGSWDHLIGNMVFLLLFGLSVELALGAAWFAALYLLGGLAAAGLHMLMEAGSMMPMVGASGAVSAVMGMFVAVYGIRRLRFFYTLGFVFGEFSAPALMVLPLWLGKEIFGYFYGDAGIAYWAHFGGLIAGFAAALLLISRRPPLSEIPQDEALPSPETRILERIESLHNQGKLLEAGDAACAAVRQHPQSLSLILRAISVTAVAPETEAYHRANLALFALAGNADIDARQIADNYQNYVQTSVCPRALSAQVCLLMARRAAQEKEWSWLEDLLRRLLQKPTRHPSLPQLGMVLVNHYRRTGEEARAREIIQLI